MDSAKLTFRELNDRIEALPQHPSTSVQVSKRTQWGYLIGFAAWGAGLLLAKLLPHNQIYTVVVTAVMLIVELVAMAVAVIPQRPWRLPGFRQERCEYAEQLDFDMPHHAELIQWLRTFPREQLEAMGEYAAHRHERLKDKLPLLTGSLEKLGALPIVIALYIQFKDLHWPPQPSWAEILLGAVLVLCYWSSLLQVSVRFRVALYETLLRKAADAPDICTGDHGRSN